jgi:flagellar export protein FliJ
VLNLKESLKKQTMKEVAEIGKQIENAQQKKEQYILEMKECKISTKGEHIKVSELQFLESHIYYLKKKIEFVDSEIARLELQMKMKQNELLEKTKESKIFQKLKESKLLQFKKEEGQLETKMLDELAIQKSSRK